jgi:hypothetical protein
MPGMDVDTWNSIEQESERLGAVVRRLKRIYWFHSRACT